MYDDNNIFAKILRSEIPCNKIHEDEFSLFFYDINPQAKIHILGIPKKNVENFNDFIEKCDPSEVFYFFDKAREIICNLDLNKTGFRLITNQGDDSNQEVPHFHIHILGGENLSGLR